MGYLICNQCKGYYKLQSGESPKDFEKECHCGGALRYVENLDIVDPSWKLMSVKRKITKVEIIRDKINSLFSFRIDFKNRIVHFYYKHFGKWIYKIQNWNRSQRNHSNQYNMDSGMINSIINQLNFQNINWILVIPVAAAMTAILAFTNGIFTILTLILLVLVGYLSHDMVLGAKNATAAGGISFLLGSLLMGSFLMVIPFTILGVINGAVCGFLGGYVKIRYGRSF